MAASQYTLTDLGTLGGNYSEARSINNAGHVLGTSLDADSNVHLFLYASGAMQDLGAPANATFCVAGSLNESDAAVGTFTIGGGSEAFVHRPGEGFTTLTTLGGRDARAFGIDNPGLIAGDSTTAAGGTHAFVNNAGILTDLDILNEPDNANPPPIVENRPALELFFKNLRKWQAAPDTTYVGIADYGDSVASGVWAQLIILLYSAIPEASNYSFPAAVGQLGGVSAYSTTGTILYDANTRVVNQNSSNGIGALTITRVGATATAVCAGGHGLTTGDTATISGATQSEYNGSFTVTTLDSKTFTFTVSGTPASPATGSPAFTTIGSKGIVDFTYLPSGDHITLGDGATLLIDGQNIIGFRECRVYLAVGPQFDSAQVDLINRDTSAVINSFPVSLNSATLGATRVQFTGLNPKGKYKVKISATGPVVELHTFFLSGSGIIPIQINCGGSTLAQNNFSDASILTYLLNDLSASLIIACAKEENPAVSIPSTMTRLGLLTGTSKLVLGSLPDSSGSAEANNAIFRTNALAAGYASYDGFAVFGSYAELVNRGWQNDGTHPATAANQFVASLIYTDLKLDLWMGTKDLRETPAATAINDAGRIAGQTNQSSPAALRAFLYDNGTKTDLGTLGGASSLAYAIDNSDRIVGASDLANSSRHAFACDGALPLVDLGCLGSGTASCALGINTPGQIVGYSSFDNSGATHAFLFENGVMKDLNSLIASGSNLVLTKAFAINDSGQIVGAATVVGSPGQTRAFLLTPVPALTPNPSPAALPPEIRIQGGAKIKTSKSKIPVKGTASGAISRVMWRIGSKGPSKMASGTTAWKFTAPVKPGKNKIVVIGYGPGGQSAPVTLNVTRSR